MSESKKEPDSEEDICEAFKVFDNDGTGLISSTHLKTVLMSLGEKLSEEEFDFMIKEANVSVNGDIKYQDFVKTAFSK